MRVHCDGDVIKYRAGFAAEKGEYILSYGDELEAYTYKKDLEQRVENLGLEKEEYEVEFSRRPEPVENALHNVKSILEDTQEQLETDDIVVYLSGPTNFRDEIATIREYKGNRDPSHKPVHGDAIIEYICKNYPFVVSENEEADDVIGYAHYGMWQDDPYSTVIATIDKDLDMIPGLHFNWLSENTYNVSENLANRIFFRQLLTGDSTDNIEGVPGVGPKRADNILKECTDLPSMYEAVLLAYGGDEDRLLENARLIWIRRHEGELWDSSLLF